MSLASPEVSGPKPVTLLTRPVTEIPGFRAEITTLGVNTGASLWKPMITASEDGRERGMVVFYNRITRRFTNGEIHIGTASESNQGTKRSFDESDDSFFDSFYVGSAGLFREPAVTTHTHLLAEHLATDIPSDYDFLFFLNARNLSASMILDRNGAHLLVRTRERTEYDASPPKDLIEKAVKEAETRDQISTDVQKKLNTLFSPYGLEYFYAEGLQVAEDGTVTFRKP